MAEKSYLQTGCKPSGTNNVLALNIRPKAQRKGKASWKASSLFIPCSLVPAAWRVAERSQHNIILQIFPVKKAVGFFSLQENLCFFWMLLPIKLCAYVWFALTPCRFENLITFTLVIWLSVGAPKCNPLLPKKLLKLSSFLFFSSP